jgi:hypothetical protein
MPMDEVFVPDRVAVVLAVVIIEVDEEVTEVASFDDDEEEEGSTAARRWRSSCSVARVQALGLGGGP